MHLWTAPQDLRERRQPPVVGVRLRGVRGGRVQVVGQHVDAAAAQRGRPVAGARADLHQWGAGTEERQCCTVEGCAGRTYRGMLSVRTELRIGWTTFDENSLLDIQWREDSVVRTSYGDEGRDRRLRHGITAAQIAHRHACRLQCVSSSALLSKSTDGLKASCDCVCAPNNISDHCSLDLR